MLRITVHSAAAAAKSYFDRELKRGDYYTQDQEASGHWGGQLAAALGLSGPVDRHTFHQLCDNQLPDGSGKLTTRTKQNRRIGYDLNFHAPKSVSLAYELTGDEALRDAFVDAMRETMQEIEQQAACRVRRKGRSEDRTSGNLLWAEFLHRTARPVDGIPDPHLHAHVFTFNVTNDAVEGKRKAGQFGAIVEHAPAFEAHFHARLAAKVRALGYETVETRYGWEIAGVPDRTRQKFSRRTQQIDAYAAANGISDPKVKDRLGAETREAKCRELGMDALRAHWRGRLDATEREALSRLKSVASSAAPRHIINAATALTFAIRHGFERASVLPLHQLIRTALRHAAGAVTPEQLEAAVSASGELIIRPQGRRTLVTTRTALREERQLIQGVAALRATRPGLHPGYVSQRPFLNGEQRAAVRHVLTSRDGVIAIRGVAGSGKTTLMQEVQDGVTSGGRRMITLAPTAVAAHDTLSKEGFEAYTVATFLASATLQESARGQVVWLDEAGLTGIATLNRLIDACQALSARLVLTGDSRQHVPVERGDALRLLEKAGMPCVNVTTIQRQTTPGLRRAVEAFAGGRADIGLAILKAQGAIHFEPGDQRAAKVGERYARALLDGERVLAIAPTHAEGDAVTAATRTALKQRGFLREERTVLRLVNRQLTVAQKSDAASYQAGEVVQFMCPCPGFKPGERLTVIGAVDHAVEATRADGSPVQLPLARSDRFTVYAPERIALAPGDLVRVTANLRALTGQRLCNGSRYRVQRIGPNGITLDNGAVLPADVGHLAHGYVTTSHSAQSATVDRVILSQGQTSLPAASAEQLYVSCSRARRAVEIYTDDRATLETASQRRASRGFGLDLTSGVARYAAFHRIHDDSAEVLI